MSALKALGVEAPLGSMGPTALRALIGDLQADHARLRGTLPRLSAGELANLTSAQLRDFAAALRRANGALRRTGFSA